MRHLGDITKINGAEIEPVDVCSFGAPCQDLSTAGRRKGMLHEDHGDGETTRSGLFYEAVRVIKEMRENDRRNNGRSDEFIRPRWAIYENVPGALSSNRGEDWRCVLEEIAKIVQEDAVIPGPPKGGWPYSGSIVGDGWSIAWRIHDAQFWGKTIYADGRMLFPGTPQRRKRIALVADFGGNGAGEVLFVRQGLSRDTEPSLKEGEGTSADFEGSLGEPGEE